jgi:hypothetical protein
MSHNDESLAAKEKSMLINQPPTASQKAKDDIDESGI